MRMASEEGEGSNGSRCVSPIPALHMLMFRTISKLGSMLLGLYWVNKVSSGRSRLINRCLESDDSFPFWGNERYGRTGESPLPESIALTTSIPPGHGS